MAEKRPWERAMSNANGRSCHACVSWETSSCTVLTFDQADQLDWREWPHLAAPNVSFREGRLRTIHAVAP